MAKLGAFLKEVKLEMGKVNWPTRQETVRYTLIVLGLSAFLAVFLGSLDFGFTYLLRKILFK